MWSLCQLRWPRPACRGGRRSPGRGPPFLRLLHLRIEPRRQWPAGLAGPSLRDFGIEEGRALAGWWHGLAETVRTGKYREGRFHDDLVDSLAAMIQDWRPDPAPTWLTSVPAVGGGGPVADLAARLARALGLPCLDAVAKVRQASKQKSMQNSHQQVVNLLGAFATREVLPGPVFLLDDMVDSRWTFTVVGSLLR